MTKRRHRSVDFLPDNLKDNTQVFRSMGKSFKLIDYSKNFYYVDTGVFRPGSRKISDNSLGIGTKHHRIVKNAFHVLDHKRKNEVYDAVTQYYADKKFKSYFKTEYENFIVPKQQDGKNILICGDMHVPALRAFGHKGTAEERWIRWIDYKIKQLNPDAKTVWRKKPTPKDRLRLSLREQLINDNIKVVVTFSSFVGLHALLCGVPAIMLGPSCADYLANKNLSAINDPWYPGPKRFKEHLLYLSCTQFSQREIDSGVAWEKVQALQGNNTWNPDTCLSCFWPRSGSISWKN